MKHLRILAAPDGRTNRCRWMVFETGRAPLPGEGRTADLPLPADRVELVLPAPSVSFARVKLPPGAVRTDGRLLAFAVEDRMLGEPEEQRVIHLGARDGQEILAVLDREYLRHWEGLLAGAGAGRVEVTSEILLTPRVDGIWTLVWNGKDGFLRTGPIEGVATDTGTAETPPLSLMLALRGAEYARPASIRVLPSALEAAPDAAAWARALGVPVEIGERWDWRRAAGDTGPSLLRFGSRWQAYAGIGNRLKPAMWIVLIALAVHGVALGVDWVRLAREQRDLRLRLETRFRALFPEAVAVADPVLQMRRKLAEARHAGGQADDSDFRPMLDKVARALAILPAGSLRTLSYEGGRVRLGMSGTDPTLLRTFTTRLEQAGLVVDRLPDTNASGTRQAALSARVP